MWFLELVFNDTIIPSLSPSFKVSGDKTIAIKTIKAIRERNVKDL